MTNLSYVHLTPEIREKIDRGIVLGLSLRRIAREIGYNVSTVSRELKKNGGRNSYSGVRAQKLYRKRRSNCRRPMKLVCDTIMRDTIEDHLKLFWSPEQIINRFGLSVSVSTFYRTSSKNIFDAKFLRKCLRCGCKPYKKRNKEERRGKIPDRVTIDKRLQIAEQRLRIGDFEGDSILGLRGTGKIETLADRKSRYLLAAKVEPGKSSAAETAKKIIELLSCVPSHTLTLDNGKEFMFHKDISRATGIDIYFAHPHRPCERGTNENTNRLLRQYFPKGTNFRKITGKSLSEAVKQLNDRPRKCLGYRTPKEVFFSEAQGVALDLKM